MLFRSCHLVIAPVKAFVCKLPGKFSAFFRAYDHCFEAQRCIQSVNRRPSFATLCTRSLHIFSRKHVNQNIMTHTFPRIRERRISLPRTRFRIFHFPEKNPNISKKTKKLSFCLKFMVFLINKLMHA